MNAPVIVDAPATFDLSECPEPLDENGRATWEHLFALQAHIVVTGLQAQVREIQAMAAVCDTCGGQPCVNPSFCAACRAADRAHKRDDKLDRVRRLMDDNISLDAAWNILNRERPTPEVTVEAIKHTVCKRGAQALEEPDNQERLRRCDPIALEKLDQWLREKGFSK